MYHMCDGPLTYEGLFDLLVRYKKTGTHDPIRASFKGVPLEISGVRWNGFDLVLNLEFNPEELKEKDRG